MHPKCLHFSWQAELEYRLNKEGEDIEWSEEDLESILWKHTVETCIFLEVVEGGANDWVGNCQQAIDKSVQKEVSVHKPTCDWTNSRISVACGICVSAIHFQLF